jgi:glycosyltransferase involved in cell wall biosynthesis
MKTNSGLKVIVAQVGARHSYAVPRMLHKHGALSRLYTDSCIVTVPGRIAATLSGRLYSPVSSKLRRRTVHGIPASMVFSAPWVNIRSALAFSATLTKRYELENKMLGRQMIRWGMADANVIYGMYGSGLPFWRYAKEQGLKIAVDVFMSPMYYRILLREHEAFPDWEDAPNAIATDRVLIDNLSLETIEVADLLLCPSTTVLVDLKNFVDELSPKLEKLPSTAVVPYGASVGWSGKGTPISGRILFAGGASLGKGIHYLARAAAILKGSKRHYEFRVAGMVSDHIRRHPATHALNFLGHLSKERMKEEFLSADVFVLPTLSEGSPSVVYEALALGVPVITTQSAGSVVSNGKEGLIVPERDSDAIVMAIEKVVRNRDLRAAMAEAALTTAANFNEGPWGNRLVKALSVLVDDSL